MMAQRMQISFDFSNSSSSSPPTHHFKMSTLRPKQLDNLPVDVANALAEEIFSWADQSKDPYAKGQIAGEGEEAPGRM